MSQVESGAKLELRINNIPVAFASNVQYSLSHEMENIKEIDSNTVTEYAELGTNVTFSCSMFRVAYQAAVRNGWMPKLDKLLQQPLLTATIRSKVSNTTLLKLRGLKCTGRSGSIDARGVWIETLTFVGQILEDEES